MHKVLLSVLLSAVLVAAGSSAAWALQSGGVEIGDLKSGSVVGQPFKTMDVDLEFNALEVGGKKVWYPPTAILNLRNSGTGGRPMSPVLLKVTNNLSSDHGFRLSTATSSVDPTAMDINLVLKPGETKYIGIPISDLTYVTTSGVLKYSCQLHGAHLGGTLLILK
jgi:hypothetical protein